MKTHLPVLFDKLSGYHTIKTKNLFWQLALIRDIENLLNEAARSAVSDWQQYEYAENSVLNLGHSVFSGDLTVQENPIVLAQKIKKILAAYEPRLEPTSIRVVPILDNVTLDVLKILFEINALTLFGDEKLNFSFRIKLDCSSGAMKAV